MNKFVFTCGDINGIGPEIVIKTINKIRGQADGRFYFICPQNVFETTVKTVKPKFSYEIVPSFKFPGTQKVIIISTGNVKTKQGLPTKDSGHAAFNSIELAGKLAIEKKVDAIITAPISKEAINSAGHNFPGHTEMFAEWCGKKYFVMMFLSERMNAALATIHEPVSRVSELLTKRLLQHELKIISDTLRYDLRKKNARIAVLGLNPHAGENGLIGFEEVKILKPVINNSGRDKKIDGPFSPDAFFANRLFEKYDAVFGMYHDQVLIPFKLINFGAGVNYTAGLQIVRTSPDHGTAFDIAGKNLASESSMLQAFQYAKIIVNNRKKAVGGRK